MYLINGWIKTKNLKILINIKRFGLFIRMIIKINLRKNYLKTSAGYSLINMLLPIITLKVVCQTHILKRLT